ncbi:MAG: radical SAM protein, partial [Candidatus Sumerlaeota bacterium]|nr:radical SAM protein [Candidatus Sumerlaeota bacterium]
MRRRVALITTYNPGAVGPRFIAGQLLAHGHDVKLIHLKELRATCFPTTDFATHAALAQRRRDVQYVTFQHPGELLYVPYPAPITDKEIALLIGEIQAYGPDIVGISMFSVTVEIARSLTALIHQRLKGLPVIWGGVHCMVSPDDCLKGLAPDPQTGQSDPLQVPDILCTGEGEYPMVQLMDRWEEYRAGAIPDVPGLWHVKDGRTRKFDRAPFETDLDRYAFPVYAIRESLIEDDQVDLRYSDPQGPIRYHIFVFTERGCPYRCAFCIHSVINEMNDYSQRIRRRSVDHVLDEVEKRVAENGLDHIIFHDEIFAIQKTWVLEFARKWERRFKPRGVTFTGYVHPLTTDEDMVEALCRAGLTRTGIGIQTGSERVSREVY